MQPNNAKLTGESAPAVAWNDKEILTRTLEASGSGRDQSYTHQSRALRAFFTQHEQRAVPTEAALWKWLERDTVPDRWRPTLVYLLLRTQSITNANIFRRNVS